MKKEMIVLVYENHDKWPKIIPVQHYCSGFGHANLLCSFRCSKYLPKIRFSDVYLMNTNTLNVMFEKMVIFSHLSGRLGIGQCHIYRTDGDRCFLKM